LHYLNKKKSINLIKKIKENTSENGLNVIKVFTKDIPDYSEKLEKRYGLDLFEKNELKNQYSDWEILSYSEKLFLDRNHGDSHYHRIARLIAKKN
jgi:hypothetical protein